MNEKQLEAVRKNGTRIHELKTWPQFFSMIRNGTKRFEIRRDDREIKGGDTLLLREWQPSTETYSGREIAVTVIGPMTSEDLPGGLEPGFVAMTILPGIDLLVDQGGDPWGWWMPGHVMPLDFLHWWRECNSDEAEDFSLGDIRHVHAQWIEDEDFDSGFAFAECPEAIGDTFPATLLRVG